MSYTSQKDRGTKASKSSWLITLLISLVALVAVGCGDSNEDYVFTGTNPGPANTGNVTFQFERLVAAKIGVPTATQILEFEFYNSQGVAIANANGVANPFYSAPYADTITVPNVPVGAVDYLVTARTGGTPSIPLAQYGGDLTVVAGSTVVITDADVAEPITFGINAGADFTLAVGATKQLVVLGTFSNGETYTATADADFSSNNATANVTANGLVTGVSVGSAVVTATVELLGVDYTDAVNVTVTSTPVPPVDQARLVLSPASVSLNTSTTANVVATYFAANSTTGVVVTNQTTGVAVGGLNATYTAGVVAAGNTTGTGTINVTYTSGNVTVTAPLSVTINAGGGVTPPAPGAARLEVNPEALVLAAGGTSGTATAQFFAAGATTGTAVTGFSGVVGNVNPASEAASWTVNNTNKTVTYTGATEGASATVTWNYISGGVTYTDTTTVTVDSANAGNLVSAEIISIASQSFRYPTGSTYPIVARYTLANGTSGIISGADWDPAATPSLNQNLEVAIQGASGPTFSNATGLLSSGATAGTGTLILREIGTGGEVFDSIPLTVITTATNVMSVVPAATTVAEDETLAYSVIVTYADSTTQDITPVRQARFVPGSPAGAVTIAPVVNGLYVGSLTAVTAGFGALDADAATVLGFVLAPPASVAPGVTIEITAAP